MAEELTREEKLKQAKENLAKKKNMAKNGTFEPKKSEEQKQQVTEEKPISREDLYLIVLPGVVRRWRKCADEYKDSRIQKRGFSLKKFETNRDICILIQATEKVTGAELTNAEANDFYYKIYDCVKKDRYYTPIMEEMFDLLYDRAKEKKKQAQVKAPKGQLNAMEQSRD